jgi:hypothetical protein
MKPFSSIPLLIVEFLTEKRVRRLLYLVIIGLVAFKGIMGTDQSRYTFLFYDMKDYRAQTEEHMLQRSSSEETAITRYAEETLFGPRNPSSAPLFPRETKLLSLFFRDGIVYIDLSEPAALPVVIENGKDISMGGIERGLATFRDGLARNFPFIKGTKFFIEGHSIDF